MRHILLTDANQDERTLCARLLGTAGFDYAVTLVGSAIEYADTLAGPPIDIAILGINTGFCSSADMIASLHAAGIPVILMAAPHEDVIASVLEGYGVTRRVAKTPSGYLALPKVIQQVLEREYDNVTVGGLPDALIHAVGGTTFEMTLAGKILRASGPALTRTNLPKFESAIRDKLNLHNGFLVHADRPPTSHWQNVTLEAAADHQLTGALAVSPSIDEHGEDILVGVFITQAEATRSSFEAPPVVHQRLQQITHDLKAPLRGVARTLDILRASGSSLSPDDRSLLDGAHSGVVDAIDALRNALKPHASQAHSPSGPTREGGGLTSATAIMSEVEQALRPEIERRRAIIRVGVLPELPVEDQDLRTILTNLIDNALQHSTVTTPTITVQATRRGSAWLFSVHDNGAGISSREVEKIFEMHARGSNARGAGNGLGLALCRQAVERYGGSIWVTTGAGTTFQFTLPAIGLVSERSQQSAARSG